MDCYLIKANTIIQLRESDIDFLASRYFKLYMRCATKTNVTNKLRYLAQIGLCVSLTGRSV